MIPIVKKRYDQLKARLLRIQSQNKKHVEYAAFDKIDREIFYFLSYELKMPIVYERPRSSGPNRPRGSFIKFRSN